MPLAFIQNCLPFGSVPHVLFPSILRANLSLVHTCLRCYLSPIPRDCAATSCRGLFVQETEVTECSTVKQLSALKQQVVGSQSPVMRQVFSWLFPFGPGWNSGKCSTANLPSQRAHCLTRYESSPRNVLHQLVRISCLQIIFVDDRRLAAP